MSRVDYRLLKWFGHVERMDKYSMARKLLMTEASGGRVCYIPRFFWMYVMKVAYDSIEMTVEHVRQ